MPVIALALGGAAIGLGVGAAAGATTFAALATAASIGFSIGAIAGNLLFPVKSTSEVEGSRLNDLKVTSSSFGVVQPIVYGQVRIAGNVIWSTPIQEQKTTTTTRQGKGGGGPSATSTQTSYSYFGTFAVAFCEGPIEKVQRIWADSKLIWDTSSEAFENVAGLAGYTGLARSSSAAEGCLVKAAHHVTSNTSELRVSSVCGFILVTKSRCRTALSRMTKGGERPRLSWHSATSCSTKWRWRITAIDCRISPLSSLRKSVSGVSVSNPDAAKKSGYDLRSQDTAQGFYGCRP